MPYTDQWPLIFSSDPCRTQENNLSERWAVLLSELCSWASLTMTVELLLVLAGMPSVVLTDDKRQMLLALSFFLAVLIVATLLVRWAGNVLLQWAGQPVRLRFSQAFAASLIWGLACVVVLVMISGARELMTPGAWQRQGFTSVLATASTPELPEESSESQPASRSEQVHSRLQEIRGLLLSYALRHEGRFPDSTDQPDLPPDAWDFPEGFVGTWILIPGRHFADVPLPLVISPEMEGEQHVLFVNGQLLRLSPPEVADLLAAADQTQEPTADREMQP